MSTLFISAILLLGHLSFYFYFKNDFNRCFTLLGHQKNVKGQSIQNENVVVSKLTNNILENKKILLHKSLRQLEFISEFEMYLEKNTIKNFSLEFLQEFEQIKIEAQLSTLKTTSQLNSNLKMAA